MYTSIVAWVAVLATSLVFYIVTNDRKLRSTPKSALQYCERWNQDDDPATFSSNHDLVRDGYLCEKTGRRYIVVGGGGFLGGWIVLHLLRRGEPAENIRIVDIRPPARPELQHVPFVKTNITDYASVLDAFTRPWPSSVSTSAELTVFHTAACIRFYERLGALYHLSHSVNVGGTKHIVEAAKQADATILLYTSSGSTLVRKPRLFFWPWEQPTWDSKDGLFQIMSDEDDERTLSEDEWWGNYPRSKLYAQRLVQAANGTRTASGLKTLQTGALRPGNGVYGPGGDMAWDSYIRRPRRAVPSWIGNYALSNIHVENCSLAHLQFERTLLDGKTHVGGQSYVITDGGLGAVNQDVYDMIYDMTKDDKGGPVTFPYVSLTGLYLLSHVIEVIHTAKILLPSPLNKLIPKLDADVTSLQPACFNVSCVHTICDDSRARKEIRYRTPWTSRAGIRATVLARFGPKPVSSRASARGVANAQEGAGEILGVL